MQELALHIEYLLKRHDCVIVARFRGISRQPETCSIFSGKRPAIFC